MTNQPMNQQTTFLQQLFARIRRRQLALAQAGRFRESNQFARWARRVRAVAKGFETAPVEVGRSRPCA